MAVSRYTLVDYYDVWGNVKDGWEVNDATVVEENIMIDDDATHKEILEFLHKIGYIATSDMRRLVVEEMGDWIEIYQRKYMKPLYSLRRVN